MNVWLIDDSETDILYEQIVIEGTSPGAVVRSFESAHDALDELRKPDAHWPHLILLDINMPRMTGFEFLDAFETLPADCRAATRLVMVSSSPLAADRDRAMSYHSVRDYLTKPISPSQMSSTFGAMEHRP
ncbi:response regulator [Ideonella sp. DXS29W]|uniref:Response regulator n=1 Tax=Ideonella lacteola TaxID=2984193 RepID=A0ABU9BSE1_9BURK